MSNSDTQVIITEGLPDGNPWIISELDTNLKNLALARLAALGASQGAVLRTQTAVLIEQTKQLEKMEEFVGKLSLGTATALVMDNSGKILISDSDIVSDLIGRNPSTLTEAEADRLITFTANLANSSPPVNLGGRDYAELTVTSGQTTKTVQVPVVLLPNDPTAISTSFFQPLVYYVNKAADGTLKSVFFDRVNGTNVKLDIQSEKFIAFPQKNSVYDAYQVNLGTDTNPVLKVFAVQDIIGTFPASAPKDTLYRDLSTGNLRLVGPSSANISFSNAKGFVVPSSKDELFYWFGQAGAARLSDTNAQFTTDGIKLPVEPNAVKWKYSASTNFVGGGYAHYPVGDASPSDTTLPVGTLVQSKGKYYLITGKAASFDANVLSEVELDGAPFALAFTNEDLLTIRGQYTDKITNATQRTTEQQLFLNSLLQKQNYHYDAATNVLKAFTDLNNKYAGYL